MNTTLFQQINYPLLGWECMEHHKFLASRRKGITRVIREGLQRL